MTNKKGCFWVANSLQIELPLNVYTVHPMLEPARLAVEVQ